MIEPNQAPRPIGEGPPVVARSAVTDDRSRVLKHGDTFAVFDHCGDVKSGGLDEEGLYHQGTRHLSQLLFQLDGDRPFFLSSNLKRENGHLSVALTNHDKVEDGRVAVPLGTLQLSLTKLLWNATCYQRVRLKNYGQEPLTAEVRLIFAADFADIFEVRGMSRRARGRDLSPVVEADSVVLGYVGLDGVERRTRLAFDPPPTVLDAGSAVHRVTLPPGDEIELCSSVSCEREERRSSVVDFASVHDLSTLELARHVVRPGLLETSNSQVDAWVSRATADLQMMTTELPSGPYPYAGVPWFNTPFGRDGIVTALECLVWAPEIARGVLRYLASTQATEIVPEEDAEPGKILHETRSGEMAALKEMPFGRYYGSADATPLFVVLLHAYYVRTADRALVEELWPNAEAALAWMEHYGDRDEDGFIEYQRQAETGLKHQGWKDSDDAVFHADGSLAEGPYALCEIQGYAYAARRAGAELAVLLGQPARAKDLASRATRLRERFERAFWCDDLRTYAIALDGEKRPCRIRSSNAGQCLFSGIVKAERARKVAARLLEPDLFSGWGIRTLSETEVRYNPMGYHTGTVWPHDNALIAFGFMRYRLNRLVLQIFSGLFQAGTHFDLNRMPELFCGFPKEPSEGPVLYPVACAPQAWAAGSVFLLFQACLGLEIDAPRAVLRFHHPELPPDVDWVELRQVTVGNAVADIVLERNQGDVGVHVLRREGKLRMIIEK
jgi:glycogen debranching enzyme